jgi:hypothetical protein
MSNNEQARNGREEARKDVASQEDQDDRPLPSRRERVGRAMKVVLRALASGGVTIFFEPLDQREREGKTDWEG